MSLEKAKAFLEHANRDPKIQAALQEPGRKVLDKALSLAKQHGFDCTAAELHNALREKLGVKAGKPARNDDEANCIIL